jgi:hypothetical protein
LHSIYLLKHVFEGGQDRSDGKTWKTIEAATGQYWKLKWKQIAFCGEFAFGRG